MDISQNLLVPDQEVRLFFNLEDGVVRRVEGTIISNEGGKLNILQKRLVQYKNPSNWDVVNLGTVKATFSTSELCRVEPSYQLHIDPFDHNE